MFRTSITLTFGLILGCILCSSQENLQWNPLFNGQDLNNWDFKIRGYKLGNNYGNTFRVEDGIMQVRYDQYKDGFENRFGHIFYKDPFSSYLLGVEYRFSGEQVNNNPGLWAHRNNGIMLHGQDPQTMDKDQDFPHSLEVQLLGGNGEYDRPTANLCTPGTQYVRDEKLIKTHCSMSSSKTYHGNQWVRVEVLVLRDSLLVHFVNGEEVMRYGQPQRDDGKLIRKGTISLQSESHPTDFRKVEIIDLSAYEDKPGKLQKMVNRIINEKNVVK
ncbi:hypothetical protein APR41_06160 [Salegentibacter salinarum]|uniref:3-keto-alpha-glucoside-1,2-lyase/3-keto-2-hydroxy-glucal hydratase domain-containing protein n=1 Tax=Salegentibacter salinarum TaxID=447422 RepID=A0A2N0TQN9_9FLAO|nr:DUF1080 domain-containing protein [Salegentibacter salinarum]PKD17018.1 hypothetical protein APR41_06160 [Salegentibacter salinarum]SKB53872.1 protein of unknown function [Salegentibacter salinarum]